jgi:formylglycine-generating enzyme required for sulfatase activity
MTFGRGHDEIPASCMTVEAAIHFCEWLSAKTGHEYRLPTEAEWEYAARHGKSTPYFFGSDPKQLDDYAWHAGNSEEKPRAIGRKKISPWGLYDIYGNVREWTSDKYDPEWYKSLDAEKVNVDPKNKPGILQKARRKDYPARQDWHTVRGGSYQDDATWCRSAWRLGAEEDWSVQDPQLPKSVWWHTDASFVGFRIVRSYKPAGK